ncbi:PqqD family protein [[Kitasatospora] papulosa]|uniref:PqqD family protein n=1 Tax=Streptomyces TaxID=1883 RepID=UPI003650284C
MALLSTRRDIDTLRNVAYGELCDVLTSEMLDGVRKCAARMREGLPNDENLNRNTVMVAYGGGKDSSYTLAFVRAMQLMLFQEHGDTFRLRVATNRHAGMPQAVMENIDRAYRALRLPDDPDCELLLIDGNTVRPFASDIPQDQGVVARNRLDILMTGHRTAGDARPTFCNACNLSMVNSFGVAAGYGEGVDVIVTGDSEREQRDYRLWVTRLAREFGLQPARGERVGFGGFLATLNNVSRAYFTDIHGADAVDVIADHSITSTVREGMRFFSIYGDTDYASGEHWELLTGFLGFIFDDIAFSFTESDCGNPALMAHLRALKSERYYRLTYANGLAEYVDFALALMHRKEFPPRLVEVMRERYQGGGSATRMRAAMDAYAHETYGLSEEQLVCMVYAPFTEKAERLADYLAAERPDLVGAEQRMRNLLSGELEPSEDRVLQGEIERMSGLSMQQLRVLYRSSLRLPKVTPTPGELIDVILDGDPHKTLIHTRHETDGPLVPEVLSGR